MNKILCDLCLVGRIDESKSEFRIFNYKTSEILSKYLPIEVLAHLNELKQNFLDEPFICLECCQKFQDFHKFIIFVKESHLTQRTLSTAVNIKSESRTDENDNSSDDIKPEQIVNDHLQIDTDANLLESIKINEDFNKKPTVAKQYKSSVERKKIITPVQKYSPIDSDDENSKNLVSLKTFSNRSDINSENKSHIRIEEQKRIRDFYKLNCILCDLTNFDTILLLRKHYRLVHGNGKLGHIICCSKKLTRHWELLDHINWHTNPDEFKCRKCSKTYTDRVGLKLHMHLHVPIEDRLLICDTCNKSFSLKRHLIQHFTRAHVSDNEKTHNCTQCSIAFASNSILQAHIRRVHKRCDIHICDICGKVCKSKSHYLDHSRKHDLSEQKIKCEQCNAWLKNKNSLLLHRRRAHEQSPENCIHCGNIYPNRNALQGHIKYMHRDKPIHKCVLCDKSFKRSLSLKEHMASHQGTPNLYKCSYCPKTFNSNSGKHKHRKKHHMTESLREMNNQNSIQEIDVQ